MSTTSKGGFEKAAGQIAQLRALLKVLKLDDAYCLRRHGVDKEKFILNSPYPHSNALDLKVKLKSWIRKKAQTRRNRIEITFFDDDYDNTNDDNEKNSRAPKYTMDEIQQLIVCCLIGDAEEIEVASISNLRRVERVCVYVLEDQKLDQHFKESLGKEFDYALKYDCPDNWFNLFHKVSIKKQNNSAEGACVCVCVDFFC